MQPDIDLLVVSRRIAAEHARARAERLARQSRAGSVGVALRTRLGHGLVAAGALIAGEPAWTERPSAADRPS